MLEDIVKKIKTEFERTIRTAYFDGTNYGNGQKAKEALIRSQKLINYIHEFCKQELINNGINSNRIFPPVGHSKPELKIKGFLKEKDQDVVFKPGLIDESCLVVNVRSQLSSLAKNFDTLYERTFAESLNLHLQYPKMVLGEIYMIPVYEYDDKAMLNNRVAFKNKHIDIEKYIKYFYAITHRSSYDIDHYKYERTILLIVDFKQENPKIYYTLGDLKDDNLISNNFSFSSEMFEKLSPTNFGSDIVSIYNSRFPRSNHTS